MEKECLYCRNIATEEFNGEEVCPNCFDKLEKENIRENI